MNSVGFVLLCLSLYFAALREKQIGEWRFIYFLSFKYKTQMKRVYNEDAEYLGLNNN